MKKPALIVDIDGTLADSAHRLHHIMTEPKDWATFVDLSKHDPVQEWCREIINRFRSDHFILLVTGRRAVHKELTVDWLAKNSIHWDEIHMRAEDDFRQDTIVKQELYEAKIEPHYDVLLCLEDRPGIVQMWRSKGLTCLHCASWADFWEGKGAEKL